MIKINMVVRCILMLLTGASFIYLTTRDWNIGLLPLILFLFIFAIGLFLYSTYRDIVDFKSSKSISSFIPLLFSLITFFVTKLIIDKIQEPNNSPIVLNAGYDAGVGGCWLTFRKDGSYEYVNGGPLAEHIEKGTYYFQDAFIILDKSHIDKILTSNKLLIQSEASVATKRIYPLDSLGHRIEKSINFIVYIDNRKK